ncbi:hypothetical protein KC614_00065 [candidate division WWE3 bacterium]|uniref:Uncharacterized protein n=1 Tax=candidate division WWE3 bacterium TaxID=2053526 RepID=A0A955LJV4_UNCKA|nr:hypothetical protein [candidate division WWE3 bacterium]
MKAVDDFLISKQTGELSYLYIEIPFNIHEHRHVHVIDHIHSQRLDKLPFVYKRHCEVFSGFNQYTIEVALKESITEEIMNSVVNTLFQVQPSVEEIEQAKPSTEIEVLSNLMRRRDIFAQLLDYGVSNVNDLFTLYRGIGTIANDEIVDVFDLLRVRPKTVILHTPEVRKHRSVTKKIFSQLNNGNAKPIKVDEIRPVEKEIVEIYEDDTLVHCEFIYTLQLSNVVEYQTASILLAIYHDVLFEHLSKTGHVYTLDLLVDPVAYGRTYYVFSCQTFPELVDEVKETIVNGMQLDISELDPKRELFDEMIGKGNAEVKRWLGNSLERDFNRSWQETVFGDGNYVEPEEVQNAVDALSLQMLDDFRKDKIGVDPDHVIVVSGV